MPQDRERQAPRNPPRRRTEWMGRHRSSSADSAMEFFQECSFAGRDRKNDPRRGRMSRRTRPCRFDQNGSYPPGPCSRICGRNDYMSERERTTVVSVRIAPSLLRAVQAQARAEGRSISGEIVSMIRARIGTLPKRKSVLPLTGWLARLDVPETHAEFREARREASHRLLGSTTRVRRSR